MNQLSKMHETLFQIEESSKRKKHTIHYVYFGGENLVFHSSFMEKMDGTYPLWKQGLDSFISTGKDEGIIFGEIYEFVWKKVSFAVLLTHKNKPIRNWAKEKIKWASR